MTIERDDDLRRNAGARCRRLQRHHLHGRPCRREKTVGRSLAEQTAEVLATAGGDGSESAGSGKKLLLSVQIFPHRYRADRRDERGLGQMGGRGPCAGSEPVVAKLAFAGLC